MAALDLLILDIDGVLVDARPSYDAATAATVDRYLTQVLALPGDGARITPAHIVALKRAGGFNNDWHLTYALLRRILARAPGDLSTPPDLTSPAAPGEELAAALARLQPVGPASGLGCEALFDAADLEGYGAELAAAGGGLPAVDAVCGERHADLLLFGEDPARNDLVTRLFQELYLGAERLAEFHDLTPLLPVRGGLWTRERPLIPADVLEQLATTFPLAVATGRPRREAGLALEVCGIADRVAALAGEDDAVTETLRRRDAGIDPTDARKPDPYLLRLAWQRTGGTARRCAFVGDLADDIRCAVAARDAELDVLAVGALWGAREHPGAAADLRAAGADLILEEPTELLELLEH